MIQRKQYKDLNDKQKLIYIKKNAVEFVIIFVPIILLVGTVASLASGFEKLDYETEYTEKYTNNGTHSIVKLEVELTEFEESEKSNLKVITAIMTVTVLGGVIGLVMLGSELGMYITRKLGWYTDFELEQAEKRVLEIKEALE